MGSRKWIKLWCKQWTEGSIREEEPAVRGVWADLLALAGSGQYGSSGEIKLQNGIGLTDKQLCEILNIKPSLLRRAKKRFIDSQRINISPKNAITISNWFNYQSEYDRQKPYRERKGGQPPEPIDAIDD